jgi:hypothetical protein
MNDEEELKKEENKDQIDPGLLNTLVKAGENKEGMISLDQKEQEQIKQEENDEPLFKEIKEEAVIKPGKINKKLGKYAERLLFDMKKNPEKFMINTPRGRMSIQDAIKQGYDPATKDFTEETPEQMMEKKLGGLSDSGRNKIKQLMNPNRAQVPPEEARTMGLEEGSPLIRGQQQPQPQEMPPQQGQQVSPEMLAALGGGQ